MNELVNRDEPKNEKFSIPGIDKENLVAFKAYGESMEPLISHSDILICEALQNLVELIDFEIYVILTTDCLYAKRVQKSITKDSILNQLVLIPENRVEFVPFMVNLEEVRKVFKVVKIIKNFNQFGT